MSLFKARDWWSTTVGEDEEFDQGCLCVANFDNADDELGNIMYTKFYFIQQDNWQDQSKIIPCIGGVIISMLTCSLGQTNHFEIGVCCLSAKQEAVRSKRKY